MKNSAELPERNTSVEEGKKLFEKMQRKLDLPVAVEAEMVEQERDLDHLEKPPKKAQSQPKITASGVMHDWQQKQEQHEDELYHPNEN